MFSLGNYYPEWLKGMYEGIISFNSYSYHCLVEKVLYTLSMTLVHGFGWQQETQRTERTLRIGLDLVNQVSDF